MSSDAPPKEGKNVFIGNIPYQLSEEAVIDIASTCGQVVSFRLVSDPETGRPRGYGFCEYTDKDAAASAIRNLDGYQVMSRELRVAYSHQGPKDDNDPPRINNNQQPPQQQQQPTGYNQPPPPGGLPPLPPGVDLPVGLTCPDAISKTISLLPTDQLLDILAQMKGLAMTDPTKATELLRQAPQLSFAIFQAMLLMGLVDTAVLASVVEQAAQPPPQPPQNTVPPPNLPPSRPPQGYQPPPAPSGQYGQYGGMPGAVPTPPVHHQAYQPPPMQQQQPPPPHQQPPQHQGGIDREAVLKQVLAMPQHEIDLLPPAQRDQIMELKRGLAAQGRYS
ncbi:MAG: hypothetical protein L6R40_004662 [Gallowayella cf. fulva]|nr:MAG: hypothetical protein L6R40_004662 [Xanthomendoza cf. fulva]